MGMRTFEDILPTFTPERRRCAYRIGNGYGFNPRCKRFAIPGSDPYCRQHGMKASLEKIAREKAQGLR